nr:origin recognition complex subunit 6 [Leptinotarsa decemlineata]
MLGLEKALTVSDLCVQLSCTEAKAIAEEILDKYINSHKMLNDLSHPQYVAAAVYSACKSLNLKIPKQQFIETSRLKPSQWKELSLEFEKFASTLESGFKRNKKIDTKNTPEVVTVTEEKVVLKKKDPEEVEEYDVWRQRILNEAYAALKSKEATEKS